MIWRIQSLSFVYGLAKFIFPKDGPIFFDSHSSDCQLQESNKELFPGWLPNTLQEGLVGLSGMVPTALFLLFFLSTKTQRSFDENLRWRHVHLRVAFKDNAWCYAQITKMEGNMQRQFTIRLLQLCIPSHYLKCCTLTNSYFLKMALLPNASSSSHSGKNLMNSSDVAHSRCLSLSMLHIRKSVGIFWLILHRLYFITTWPSELRPHYTE